MRIACPHPIFRATMVVLAAAKMTHTAAARTTMVARKIGCGQAILMQPPHRRAPRDYGRRRVIGTSRRDRQTGLRALIGPVNGTDGGVPPPYPARGLLRETSAPRTFL